jgi:hypothetical protein
MMAKKKNKGPATMQSDSARQWEWKHVPQWNYSLPSKDRDGDRPNSPESVDLSSSSANPVKQPAIDQPAIDQPAIDQPAIDQPAIDQPAIDQDPTPTLDEPTNTAPSPVQTHTTILTATDHLLCAWCPVCLDLLLIRHPPMSTWSFFARCNPLPEPTPAWILLPVLCRRCLPPQAISTIHMSPTIIQQSCIYQNLQKLFPHQATIYIPTCIPSCNQALITVNRDTLFKELPPGSHMIGLDPRITTEKDIPANQMLLPYLPSACL